jgi:hypothetical protein
MLNPLAFPLKLKTKAFKLLIKIRLPILLIMGLLTQDLVLAVLASISVAI